MPKPPPGGGEAQAPAKDGAKAADAADTAKAAEDADGTASGDSAPATAADAKADRKDAASDAEDAAAAEADDDAEDKAKADKPATKRVYTFEDAAVKVTATLEKADAIPDDAELKVTAVTPQTRGYNYDAYMEALNKDAGEQDAYTADNTLLYDVAFLAKDADGNTVELQPESGFVKVAFEFKKAQLSEGIGADAESLQVVHLPLKDAAKQDVATTKDATDIVVGDILVEDVETDAKVAKSEVVSFESDSLSVWAFTGNEVASQITISETTGAFKDSDQCLIKGTFGELANFGLIGFTSIQQDQHIHSNIATKTFIVNVNGTFGMRAEKEEVKNEYPDVSYIGTAINGNLANGYQIESFVPGSRIVLGHDLGESGSIDANPTDKTYKATFGGVTYGVSSGEEAAVWKDGHYESSLFRQESASQHFVDLAAMQAKAIEFSSKFSERSASEVSVTENYGGNGTNILLTERGDQDIATMNFKASDVENKVFKIDEAKVDNKSHLLIINIDAAGRDTITLPRTIEMLNTSQKYTDEVVKWTSGNVILNVYDSSKADKMYTGAIETVAGMIAASILAPKGTVVAGGNVNGQIIADKIVVREEFHRDSITFTNEIPSVGGLRVAKTLDGSNTVSQQFEFKLESIDGSPMPAGSANGELTKKNEADGLVTFGFLNFDENEFNNGKTDYRYKVSEVVPSGATDLGDNQKLNGDFVYDANTYIIEVHAARTSSGGIGISGYTIYESDGTTVVKEISYDEGKKGVVTFANGSASNTATAVLQVTKSFNGSEWPADGFTFKLKKKAYDDGNGKTTSNLDNIMPPEPWRLSTSHEPDRFYDELTVTKSDPTATFKKLIFNNVGTYYYSIKEVIPAGATPSVDGETAEKDNIVYDNTEHEVIVKVTEVAGKKIATVKYDGKNSLTVKNSVVAANGSLAVSKIVKGAPDSEAGKVFKFTIQQSDGDKKYLQEDGSFGSKPFEFSVQAGNSKLIEDIPVGDYVVAEVADSAKIDGYALTASGGGEVSVSTSEKATSTLTNTYVKKTDTDATHDSVTVKKTDGAAPLAGATFTLYDDNNPIATYTSAGEEGLFTISTDDESLEGVLPAADAEKTLTLKETAAPANYVASTDEWILKISAQTGAEHYVDSKDAFVTTTTYTMKINDKDSLTVANQAVGKLKVSKTVNGPAEAKDKTFKFTVQQANGDKYVQEDGSLDGTKQQFEIAHDSVVTITNVPIGEYVVTEIIGNDTKVAGYALTSEVANNGSVTVSKGDTANVDISNTYTEKERGETEHSKVTVTKTDGASEISGATFMLYDGNDPVKTYSGGRFEIKTDDPDLSDVLPAVGDLDGKTLTLKETAAPEGYKGSTDTWEVKITATKVGPTLVEAEDAFVTTTKYAITVAGNSSLTVANQELGSLKVTKKVEGDSPDVSGKSFEFIVQPEGQTGENGKYVQNDGSVTGAEYKFSVGANGTVEIDNIPAGNYVVKEVLDSAQVEGYVVNASVVPDGNIEVSKAAPVAVTITNTYRHITDDLKGKKSIEVVAGDAKELTDNQFEFSIVRKQATDPDGVYEAGLISSAKNKDNGEIDFGTIAFTKPGTYVYEVKETSSSANGFTKDDTVYTVTYVVAENMSFTKTIKVGEDAANEIAFTNTYTATPVTLNFAGEKTLLGKTLGDKQFSFKMEGTSDNAKGAVKTVQNAADGTISFEPIEYTQPGIYKYKVTEIKGSEPGIEYDNKEYEVVVTVSDNKAGQLTTTVTVNGDAVQTNGTVTGLNFANTVLKGTAKLGVSKKVKGETPNPNEEFEFTLVKENDAKSDVLSNPTTVKIKAGSAADFGTITYNQEGIYLYKIIEEHGDTPSMNYDTAPKWAKVVVKPNGKTTGNTLDATVTYANTREELDSSSLKELEVTNKYETVSVSGKKIWADNDNVLGKRPGTVTVQLQSKSGDGEWADVKGKTATITDANLTYDFGNLPKYADAERQVEIQYRVIDAVEGYTTTGGTSAEGYDLTNTIIDKKADAEQPVTLTLHKTGAGDAVLPGAKFTLTDSEQGTKTYTTNGEGNITITFEEPGNWTLKETAAPAGYVLDDTVYAITVTRSDNPIEVKFYQGAWTSIYNLIFGSPELQTGNVLNVTNDQTKVSVSKVDIANSKEVSGATIQILATIDGKEKIIDEWESEQGVKHEVSGLLAGVEYTLHETVAPDGYTIAADTTFTIDENGQVIYSGKKGESGELLVQDAKTKVKVSKTDIASGEELEGAHIQIIDSTGKVVKEWDSTDEAYEVEGLKTGEEYILRETVAPEGYTVTTDTKFTIDEKGVVSSNDTTIRDDGVLLVEDSKTKVTVSKVDIADGKELEGAKIQILNAEGDVVKEWTSTDKPYVVEGLKTGVEYTLHEEVAPDGYTIAANTTFTIETDGTVKSGGTEVEGGKLLIKDSKTQVKVSKVDIADNEEIAEATIRITDSQGNQVAKWVSKADDKATENADEGVYIVEGLKVGETYTLEETVAPEGYTVAAKTTFSIDKNGKVTSGAPQTADGTILVKDSKTKVTVSKVDVADGEELEGATIQIIDKDGKVVEEWVSGKEAHEVEGLKTGEEYTLRETVAPEGYTVTTDTKFTIDKKGDVTSSGTISEDGVLLVEDSKTSVKVSKVDATGGQELAGATIQILDKDGNVVEEWVSTDEAHEVEGLLTGVEYTLHEEVAPDGYLIAADTTFTIDEEGNVTSGGTITEDGVLLVKDELAKVNVSKVDAGTGDEVAGATIQVLEKDGDGKVVDEWTSTDKPHGVAGVETGKTYILKETVAPDGYTITTEIEFTINEDGTVTTEANKSENGVILVEDTKTKVAVSKVDIAGGKEVAGAHIQILDKDGKVVEEWDSTTKAHVVEGLKTGEEYTLHETVAPAGYTIATDNTFKIRPNGEVETTAHTDKDGALLVEDSKTFVRVSKTDVTGDKELSGAHIQILDKDGKVVEEWDSTNVAHEVEGLSVGVKYTLHETVAPDGYTIASNTAFQLNADGTIDAKNTDAKVKDGVLLVEDSKTSVKVSKTDIAGGEELEGAKIQILGKDGKVVEEWTSGKEAHEITGLKTGVEYTLHEEVAPDGYTVATDTKFTIDENGNVTTGGSVSEDGTLLIEDAITKVRVSKVDVADGKELEGAHIQIVDKSGKVVEEWDSTKEAHVVTGLFTEVEYTLKETVAPDGYTIATATTFTIEKDGTVTGKATKTEDGTLLVEDAMTKISVKKTDVADGEELEGAHIQIIDKDGNIVDEWDSTKEAHEVTGLKTNEEYTLKETVAPEGYTITTDTKFTIGENGKVTSTGSTSENGELLVEDAKTKVKVSKTDIASGDELEGAHIQIIDSKGNVVEEWDSTDKAHEVEGLKTGEKYTLKETVAPDGYTIATETTFTIDETGKVTSTGNVTDDGVLLVEDAKTSVKVSKTDITGDEELEGAEIQILDADGNVVEKWTSTKEAHEVTGLKTGVEYTLHEEVAPNGYSVATDTTFTIDEKGKVTTTATTNEDGVILIEDAITTVSVSKVDAAGGKELAGATIQILDKDGKVVEEWISTTEVHVVKGLTADATYTLKETVAPDGYTVAAETKFTIAKDGKVTSEGTTTEDGVLLIEDSLTKVKVSKTDIANGEELEGATIQIVDKDGNVVDEWTSGKDAHEVEGLKTGETYTLKETVAPNGYGIATETTFTIDETGKVTTTGTITEGGVLLVEDSHLVGNLVITKTVGGDVTKKEVEDAAITFTVTTTVNGEKKWLDKDGNLVDKETVITLGKDGFVSDDGGKTYTKTFENVPTGDYTVTERNSAIEGFNLVEKDSVTKAEAAVTDGQTATAELKDFYEEDTTNGGGGEDDNPSGSNSETIDITINKYLTGTQAYVAGATLQLVDKATGDVVDEWTTAKAGHKISDVETGKVYILKETKAPSGYALATDVEFEIVAGDTPYVKINSGAKLKDGSRNARAAGEGLDLYDAKKPDKGGPKGPGEEKDKNKKPTTPTNKANNTSTNRTTSSASTPARTGDENSTTLMALFSVLALASVGVFEAARRRRDDAA